MRLTLALCALLWACGGKPSPPRATSVAHEVDPNLQPGSRLSDASIPKAYDLHLQIDPKSGAFRGTVEIDIEITEPVHTLWLHQRALHISDASFRSRGQALKLELVFPEDEETELVSLVADRQLPAGPGRLRIDFKAHFGNVSGIFRQLEQRRWYAYSDFEANDARSAFPCYDEPRFKVPWTVSIDVPAGNSAFSNSPEAARETLPSGDLRFVFAQTRPLPSYLVAVAAGPFDVIEGKASKTPLRIIAPRGQAELGRFVLENTDTWLRFFESYLGMAMPYPKLDFIAVPHFSGAMENPGLVTFSSGILLTGSSAGDDLRRLAAGVTNHELAHMWFGDFITPRDWKDLWLNEGFATWLSDKAVAAYQPHRAREILDIADKSSAFASDHSLRGRRVRQAIDSRDDVRDAFGAITYRKGGALLTMLEAWIGEKLMQKAVRRYARSVSDGSVSTEDMLSEFLAATNNRQVVSFLHSFLSQTGIPKIRFDLQCEGTAQLQLSQSRYLPVSSSALASDADRERNWQLPVCFRYGTGAESTRQCVFLSESQMQIDLEGGCPSWLQPNDGDSGYYHSLLPAEGFATLAARPLDPREAQGLVYNIVFAVESGDLSLPQALPLLAEVASQGAPELQTILVPFLYRLSYAFVGEPEREAFAQMIRSWYGARVRALGMDARKAERAIDAELRPLLLRLVADLGRDQELRAMATTRVTKLLSRSERVDLDLLSSLLEVAAIEGDRALMSQYLSAMQRSSDSRMRALLLGALHAFEDPTLFAEALGRSLSRSKHHGKLLPILARAAADPARAPALWKSLREHRAELLEHSDRSIEMLSHVAHGLCSEDALTELVALAEDLDLREAIEEVRGCVAFAAEQGPGARAYFAPAP